MKGIINWISKYKETLLKSCYSLPILFAIFISINHCIKWFEIANPHMFAVLLSIAVEVAAVSTLLALIFSKSSFNVWITFIIVTFVQILGNVFFSFNFIDEHGQLFETWQKFIKIIFSDDWTLDKSKFWLSVLIGSIVPLLSLLSLDLIAKFELRERKKEAIEEEGKMKVLTTTNEIKRDIEEVYHRPGTAVLDKVEEMLKNEPVIQEEDLELEEEEIEMVEEEDDKKEEVVIEEVKPDIITPVVIEIPEEVPEVKREVLPKKVNRKAGPLVEGIPPKTTGIIPRIKIKNK